MCNAPHCVATLSLLFVANVGPEKARCLNEMFAPASYFFGLAFFGALGFTTVAVHGAFGFSVGTIHF